MRIHCFDDEVCARIPLYSGSSSAYQFSYNQESEKKLLYKIKLRVTHLFHVFFIITYAEIDISIHSPELNCGPVICSEFTKPKLRNSQRYETTQNFNQEKRMRLLFMWSKSMIIPPKRRCSYLAAAWAVSNPPKERRERKDQHPNSSQNPRSWNNSPNSSFCNEIEPTQMASFAYPNTLASHNPYTAKKN